MKRCQKKREEKSNQLSKKESADKQSQGTDIGTPASRYHAWQKKKERKLASQLGKNIEKSCKKMNKKNIEIFRNKFI